MKLPFKLFLSLLVSFLWVGLSYVLARPWLTDIESALGMYFAWYAIVTIAFIPGWALSFITVNLVLDKRPHYAIAQELPGLTVLIAAYNEQGSIYAILNALVKQEYPGHVEIIVIDDGSTDETIPEVKRFIVEHPPFTKFAIVYLRQTPNQGKANALNLGLRASTYRFIVTVDADSYLMIPSALASISNTMMRCESGVSAVAGTTLVHNTQKSIMTMIQVWDYLLGIAAVKRIQSMYKGTLVAQGAFSIYRKEVLEEVGGWPDTIGEDIVLTWAMRSKGYKVSYDEHAIVFTNVPQSYIQYFRQRKRWARGLVEAFHRYPNVMWDIKMNSPFIFYNLTFPFIDFTYLCLFIPGVIGALLFGWYLLVGWITLSLLPLAVLINLVMFSVQKKTLKRLNMKMPRISGGAFAYVLFYQLLLTPATLSGYFAEMIRLKEVWGKK